ncbi:MAG: hypothetical protein KAX30_04025, partial [Candidatus Atribacteria bacterium]|nr:hypothetical protein [Candidatus Atribacteria bacterium]
MKIANNRKKYFIKKLKNDKLKVIKWLLKIKYKEINIKRVVLLEKEQFDVIGKRYDIKNIGKVTGEEVYSCDVNIPGQLYAVVLRSPYSHAEIKKIDYTEAEKMGAICIGPDDVPDTLYNERIVSIPDKTYRD